MTLPVDDAFARQHEPMVRRTAKRVARELALSGIEGDLVGIGWEALLLARQRYDASQKIPFEGYAYYRVRWAMIQHAPRHDAMSRKTLQRILAAGDAIAEQHAEERAVRDDAEDVDYTSAGFEKVLGQLTGALICARLAEEQETPETRLALELERARVRKAIEGLDPREKILLFALYWHDRTLDDVAPEIGVTESGASRMHVRALESLRRALAPPFEPGGSSA